MCLDFHPFVETLWEWETGVPVDCGKPWSWETIEAAVEKGAHKSALTPELIKLIAEDVAYLYQVKTGYAQVITWGKLQRLRPKNLKVSPLAVVLQRNQRGRMILDLFFAVRRGRTRGRKRSHNDEVILQESFNDSTVRQAPVKELTMYYHGCWTSWWMSLLTSTSISQRWTSQMGIGKWSWNPVHGGILPM
jgi:hypothetical protein